MTSPTPETTIPTLSISAEETDPGWRRVETGEVVRTHFQVYTFMPHPDWRISSYWTSEGLVNTGRSNYREAVSPKTWLTVAPQLGRKVWKRAMNLWRLPPS